MSMDLLRFRVLRAFGVAPWSEEAKGLTDEMCLEYAALLEDEGEKQSSAAFDESAYNFARAREYEIFREADTMSAKSADSKTQLSAMSDYIEREMRRRDNGFITY